jgi:hypothetical protein
MMTSEKKIKILIILGELGPFFFPGKKEKKRNSWEEIYHKRCKNFLRKFLKNLGKKTPKGHCYMIIMHLIKAAISLNCGFLFFVFFFLAHNMK